MFLEIGCRQTGLFCCSRATSREGLLSHVHVGVEASGEGLCQVHIGRLLTAPACFWSGWKRGAAPSSPPELHLEAVCLFVGVVVC